MNKSQFQQYAEQIKDEVIASDYRSDDVSKVPIIRIHTDKTQEPPENSKIGWFYGANAGYISPTSKMRVTIFGVTNIAQLWTEWTSRDRHIICKCFKAMRKPNYTDQGVGIPFIEEDGRWSPGENERQCAKCRYNPFRIKTMEMDEPLLVKGKPFPVNKQNMCGSGKLFHGVILPDLLPPTSEQIEVARQAHITFRGDDTTFDESAVEGTELPATLENIIPFYFQVGAVMFSGAYTKLPYSWEAFEMGCKLVKPNPIPWNACKLELITQIVDTNNGPVYAPMFRLVGVHAGMLDTIRAIENSYQQQLALSGDVKMLPEIPPEAPEA